MIMPGDLEVRPPIPGESLDGYVAEITAANDLMKVRRISGFGGVAHGHRPQLATTGWSSLPDLAELLQVDVAELQLRSHRLVGADETRRTFFGTTVHRADLRTRERYFSPLALTRSAYHRAMWQLRLPFDYETGDLLVSTCPKPTCGKVQRWRHSAGVRYCDTCVQDLSAQEVPRLSGDRLIEYQLIAGLTHTDAKVRRNSLSFLPNEIQELGADSAFELLLRLVPVVEPKCGWGNARLWENEPFDIATGMALAWQMLQNWPDGILEQIARQAAIATNRASDGNGGRTAAFFRLRNSVHVPGPVARTIRAARDRIDEDGPNREQIRLGTMDTKEGAKILKTSTAVLVPLRRQGVLKSTAIARGPLIISRLDRAEVERVVGDIRNRFDLTSAAVALGLPYYAAEQLAALGHLTLMTHPYLSARYREVQINKDSLKNLIMLLSSKATGSLEAATPITSAARMIGARLKPWDAIINAMLQGTLPFALIDGSQPLFDRIMVRKSDLRIPAAMPITRPGVDTPLTHLMNHHFVFTDGLTKQDAGEILNLQPKQVLPLLSDYSEKLGRTVPVLDIVSLANKYISTAEISARLDINYKLVLRKARELQIRRISNVGFERDTVERLMFC